MNLQPLRLLIIDDSPLDAELILRELNGSFATSCTRVDTAEAMERALESGTWDIVISDFVIPGFSGLDAITLLRQKGNDLPIIVVSGKVGEDAAVETMRAGANDYIIKDNLSRLVPAIRRELADIAIRRERRYAEKAMHIAEEQLRKLSHAVEQSPVSIVITDRNGTIEYVNPKFTLVSGYPASEVIGRNPRILKSGRMPEEEYRRLWKNITAGREWHGEILNRKKNGEYFWERASISAIRDKNGEITHFVGVKEDITEQRRIEEAEHRSWKLSEAMATASLRFLETGSISRMAQVLVDRCVSLTSSSFGFLYDLLPDGDARILAVAASPPVCTSDCEFFNRMAERVDGGGFLVVPRRECLLFGPVIEGETILTNDPSEYSHLLCQDEFSRAHISSFLGTPLKVGTKVVGTIGLANKPDGFTELEQRELEAFAQTAALALHSANAELEHKQAMEQLRQAQKMEAVGQLAGGVAHDFNNLLTVINGYSTLILHEMSEESPYRDEVEHILQAGERAADLTHQLLAFSRRQILEPKVININLLVKNVEKMLKRLIRENIVLKTRLSDRIGMLKADPGQVEQIVINLVVNARDALENGGIITIETADADLDATFVRENRGAVAGSYIMLAVHDNGTGMTDEVKRKIFEPFFTTKAQGRGTGLGLATVYGIVKQSGGYIQVLSESGTGSSFRVFLPREEGMAEREGGRDRQEPPRGSETILVVEDEAGVLNLAVRTLKRRGYTVLQAGSPSAASALFQQHRDRIDLVLSDVVMPEKSGPKLAEEFRALRPDLKIMFMSGYTDDAIVPREITEERTAFILKPFTPDTLAGKVRELLVSRT